MTAPVVLVTREEAPDGPLASALERRGLRVRSLPLLVTLPPEDAAPLEREAARLEAYDWVVVTSARAARALREAMRDRAGEEAGALASPPRWAAVGEGTARALREAGGGTAVAGAAGGEELVREMSGSMGGLEGAAVLFPAADRARRGTIAALEAAGARVTVVTAYRTVETPGAIERLDSLLRKDPPDAIAFTSPSAVEVFARAAGAVPPDALPRLAAIGATTARALEEGGFPVWIAPGAPGFETLADALAEGFAHERKGRCST